MNDFAILGLDPSATPDEAKLARRALVRKNHPDQATDKEAASATLAEINAAYDRIKAGKPILGGDGGKSGAKSSPRSAAKSQTGKHERFNDYPDFDAEDRETERRRREEQSAKAARDARAKQAQRARGPRGDEQAGQTAGQNTGQGQAGAQTSGKQARQTVQTQAPGLDLRFSSSHREAMKEAIAKRMKSEAHRRVTELRGGIYSDPRKRINTNRSDLPGFHMADHIMFRGRTMEVHFADRAKDGRNIIAMPEMAMIDGNRVRQGAGVRIFEVEAAEGKVCSAAKGAGEPITNAQGMQVQFVFDSQRVKDRLSKRGPKHERD